jgi:amidase
MDSTYHQALTFTQTTTRALGIDYALTHYQTDPLSALLVPPDVGQTYQIAAQAGYPVITLPAGINRTTSMPFGLALMGTAWSEAQLVRCASAVEDLGMRSGERWGRTRPGWGGYTARNVPVLNL